jgi:hypothetical protein
LFYWKFNQANQLIFPLNPFLSINKVINRRSNDLIKIDRLVWDLFELKIKLNSYLKFIYFSAIMDFILLFNAFCVYVSSMVFFVENEMPNILLLIFALFISSIFFISILAFKIGRVKDKMIMTNQVDIIGGIQRMRCSNNYFNVHNNVLLVEYQVVVQHYHEYMK